MALRPEEEFVAESLEAYFSPRTQFSWREGEDPPDLTCEIAGKEWGIEVTELHQITYVRGRRVPRAAIERPLEKLCIEIRRQAAASDLIKGHYYLVATGSIGRRSAEIVRLAMEHMEDGRQEETDLGTNGAVVLRPNVSSVISPVSPVRWIIAPELPLVDPEMNAVIDVLSGVKRSLVERLSDKLPKLRRLTQYERRALALVQEFFVADPDDLRTVLNSDDFKIDGSPLSGGDLDQILYVTASGAVHIVWAEGAQFI